MSEFALTPTRQITRSADFKGDYLRWRLTRRWGGGPRALVCMANPSTADARRDDPTIRRLLRLLDRPGLDGFTVVNWEPFIAPSWPDLLRWRKGLVEQRRHATRNLSLIRSLTEGAAMRIVAWGDLVPPDDCHTWAVLAALSGDGRWPLLCFGTTAAGAPMHPMARGRSRIPDDVELKVWRATA